MSDERQNIDGNRERLDIGHDPRMWDIGPIDGRIEWEHAPVRREVHHSEFISRMYEAVLGRYPVFTDEYQADGAVADVKAEVSRLQAALDTFLGGKLSMEGATEAGGDAADGQ